MARKMKGVTLVADWVPKPDFVLGPKDVKGKQTYLGSRVWKNPRIEIREYDVPEPGDEEVLIEVKACGICGSDVHMAQADEEGYILYPGLTGFPAIMGHELSGVVVKAGKGARNKRTNKPFDPGEEVTVEDMLWCGQCKPCADGFPNQCEQLDEIGFNVPGAYTKYLVVPSRVVWSLAPLNKRYSGKDLFLAGSLVEPTSGSAPAPQRNASSPKTIMVMVQQNTRRGGGESPYRAAIGIRAIAKYGVFLIR